MRANYGFRLRKKKTRRFLNLRKGFQTSPHEFDRRRSKDPTPIIIFLNPLTRAKMGGGWKEWRVEGRGAGKSGGWKGWRVEGVEGSLVGNLNKNWKLDFGTEKGRIPSLFPPYSTPNPLCSVKLLHFHDCLPASIPAKYKPSSISDISTVQKFRRIAKNQ